MDLFSELQSAVQSDMTIGSESTLYPLTTVKLAINRSYRKAGALFRWPPTEDAKTTSTIANKEYYDYPENWLSDSIWKLLVDSEDYFDPLTYEDYLYEKENDIPSGADYLWSSYARRYFIYPTPTTATSTISIWGQKVVTALTSDSDTTIFSYSMPEGNEAVVLEAVAILKAKGEDEQKGVFRSAEAKQILVTAWGKIKQEQARNEPTTPMLDVPDFFAGRTKSTTRIGNF